MPRARRTPPVEAPQPEETRQNDTPIPVEQTAEGTLTPTEGVETPVQGGQPTGDTSAPTEGVETPVQGGQPIGDTPAPTEGDQPIGDTPAPTEGEEAPVQGGQPIGDTPAPTEGEETPVQMAQTTRPNQLLLTVRIKEGDPAEDIAATADVDLGSICTIRNVKIKNDDYGLKVVMPKTKMPDIGRFKDACVFHSREVREQFDTAVLQAYQQQTQGLQQESGQPDAQESGYGGMTM